MIRRTLLAVVGTCLALACFANVAAADCAALAASAGDAEVVTLSVPGMT
jgi:hypothetical protein